jgi:hypothetical protein
VNSRKLSAANIVILAAGAVMLIGSFLAFYTFPGVVGTISLNAWDHGLFMIRALPALLGALMALQIALVTFGNITMPNRMLGLTWDQFHLVIALQTALLMLTFLGQARPPLITFGAGFWLMLGGAAGLVVGALMRLAASRRRPHPI